MNALYPFILVMGLVVVTLLIPPRFDPAIRIKEWQIRRGKHPEAREPGDPQRWRDFIVQAERDQRSADYPGCELGLMQCRSQSCGCCEARPSRQFVRSRAEHLAEEQDK